MSTYMNGTCCADDRDLTLMTPAVSGSARVRRAGAALLAALETLFLWRERVRQRRALMTLDPRLLRDIGLDLGRAEAEYRKPFWRA